MQISLKKKLAAAATVLTVLGGASVAVAYWTSTGTGSGSATAGTSSAWEVTTDAATGSLLTPGGPTQTVAVHVKNNSSGAQGLAQVVARVANADGTAWSSGTCDADDFSVSGEAAGASHTITYSPVENVAAGATKDDSVTITMINKTTVNQDDCKSVTVPLYFAAS